MVILLQDGTWKPIFNLHCGSLTVRQSFDLGAPISMISQKFEDCVDEFPDLPEFVDNVIQKLKPPVPHVFCVQGFQVSLKVFTIIIKSI